MIEQKKIGIIGINGRYGKWLERFFERQGQQTVIGSDTTTDFTNRDVVERSDVVIFAAPLPVASGIIKEVVPFSRPGQLFVDICSLKTSTVNEMMCSNAEVLGLHPLFAPPKGETWEGETVATVHARVDKWSRWTHQFLQATGAQLMEVAPSIHDHVMLGSQNLPHIMMLAYALSLGTLGILPNELTDLSTPISRRMREILNRMLQQSSEVYIDIQLGNPDSIKAINAALRALAELRSMIEREDREGLVRTFAGIARYFDDRSDTPSEG